MAYIYKITNQKNGKLYIGKTTRTISERFAEHIRHAKNEKEDFPLYRAMRKYGVESFTIEKLLECPDTLSSFYEMEEIVKNDSYKNGYNATLGGEGKVTTDYFSLAESFLASSLTLSEFSRKHHKKEETIRLAIQKAGLRETYEKRKETLLPNRKKKVFLLEKTTGKPLNEFSSIYQGALFVGKTKTSQMTKIKEACTGKRKSAFGYQWRFAS